MTFQFLPCLFTELQNNQRYAQLLYPNFFWYLQSLFVDAHSNQTILALQEVNASLLDKHTVKHWAFAALLGTHGYTMQLSLMNLTLIKEKNLDHMFHNHLPHQMVGSSLLHLH